MSVTGNCEINYCVDTVIPLMIRNSSVNSTDMYWYYNRFKQVGINDFGGRFSLQERSKFTSPCICTYINYTWLNSNDLEVVIVRMKSSASATIFPPA